MKKEYQRINEKATLVKKESNEYFPIPGRIPYPEMLYELVFETNNGIKRFQVSRFEYDVVEEGYEGELVTEGTEIIRFGNWIKEFKM